MDLSVRLPTSHPGLEHYFGKNSLIIGIGPTNEVIEWLAVHGKSLYSMERDQAVDPRWPNWDRAGMTFHFTDRSEALLFKLTWL